MSEGAAYQLAQRGRRPRQRAEWKKAYAKVCPRSRPNLPASGVRAGLEMRVEAGVLAKLAEFAGALDRRGAIPALRMPWSFLVPSSPIMNVDGSAADNELVSRWLGRTIKEKYVVESVIGSGGMAVVYSARHRNGKRFALKMLHRELSLNPLIRQRFVREGYVANRVEHDGAVAVIDDDVTEDGSAFLIMELLHGVTLECLWEANDYRLPLDCVLAIADQLLDVLTAAHAQNIVHRDLKPANIFLTRKGTVKILDFGIARLREGDGSKTESGTTLGTPLFMPPEQASGRSRDIDGRTDLWALGATLFSLLSGQYVHDGENAAQVLIAVATTPAKSLASVLPHAPPAVITLIDKALAFYNEDRWDSAAVMRAAVLAAQSEVGPPVSRDTLGQIVRSTAKGASNSDGESTPGMTPPPNASAPTERLPSQPSAGPRTPAPGTDSSGPRLAPSVNSTKRIAPVAGGSQPIRRSSALLDSSTARALTPATVTPALKSTSHALIGGIVVAALSAIGGAIIALRVVVGASQPAPATSAPAVLATPLTSPPPTASMGVVPLVSPSASAEIETSAKAAPGRLPPPLKLARRPAGGVKLPGSASAPVSGSVAPSPPSPAVEPTPAPAVSPANPQLPGRKPAPTLDRTSPFGN